MKTFGKHLLAITLLVTALAFTVVVSLPQAIQQGLDRFYSDPSQARIHLVFNQPGYAPGDTAFFKAYLLKAADPEPVKGKNVLNIKLADANGQTVFYNRILVQDGTAVNQLVLPDTLGGRYTLVAYTDVMAESDPGPLYFQREFIVAASKQTLTRSIGPAAIFIEGGKFVAGFRNTLVVSGLNPGDSGSIVDGDNATIVKFKVSTSGLGKFQLTPELSRAYYLKHGGNTVPLPSPVKNGVALAVNRDDSGNIVATLSTGSDSIRALGQLHLIVIAKGEVCQAKNVSFGESSTLSRPITTEPCSYGTAQLTLFTAEGQPLAERLILIHPDPVQVDVQINKPEFRTRQKIDVSLNAFNSDGTPLKGEAVMSVYKKSLFDNVARPPDLTGTAFFGSDLGYDDTSFSSFPGTSNEEIDNFLITQRWIRFTWNEIVKDTQTPGNVAASAPVYFKGRVYDASRQPVPDGSHITFWLTHHDVRYTLQTKGNQFAFPLFMNLTDEYVMYAVESKGRLLKDAVIELDQNSMGDPVTDHRLLKNVDYPYGEFARVKNSVRNSFIHYTAAKQKELNVPVEDRDVTPDFTVDIRKYKAFNSVAEILGEVVPMVRNKKVDGKNEVRVFLKETAMFASDAPLYLIDGVLTDDTEFFLSLDPSAISTIGVVHSADELTRYGILGRNGIVLIETTIPRTDITIPKGKSTLQVKGVNESISFKSRSYQSGSHTRVPDMRSSLYWNPGIILDGTKAGTNVAFYAGDDTGTYVLRVEGLTHDGRPFLAEKTFTIGF